MRFCVDKGMRPGDRPDVPIADARDAFGRMQRGEMFGKLVLTV